MAKRATKKTAGKRAKSATAKKSGRSSKSAAAKKPARRGGSHVKFGVHGMTSILKAVHEAGLESELNDALGHDDKFVNVQRKSLAKIKDFVTSKPQLAAFAAGMQRCDCDPNDPYCIYI